jgi:uncharacterized protein
MSERLDPHAIEFIRMALCARGLISALRAVAALDLPDCWIAAGAVRNAVWDLRSGFITPTPLNDVDVIWFGQNLDTASADRCIERMLSRRLREIGWSVKNQARMHLRHGHRRYAGCLDAMNYWPETATAVAVRLLPDESIEVLAPFGLGDLLGMIVRPAPAAGFRIVLKRMQSKGWLRRWPALRIIGPDDVQYSQRS